MYLNSSIDANVNEIEMTKANYLAIEVVNTTNLGRLF